jgi:hypothetical protein
MCCSKAAGTQELKALELNIIGLSNGSNPKEGKLCG